MSDLIELFTKHEAWLIDRILYYAKKQGYNEFTPTLKKAWTVSIQGLTASIIEGYKIFGYEAALNPEENSNTDPITTFGVSAAKQHRKRGISISMFVGLLKFYRLSYLDLIGEKRGTLSKPLLCERFIERCFDRIEVALCEEWDRSEPENFLRELQESNRKVTNDKNTYQAIFESLIDPVILLNLEKQVIHLNYSASCLIFSDSMPGENNRAAGMRQPIETHMEEQGIWEHGITDETYQSILGKAVEEVFPWLSEVIEKIFKDPKSIEVFECAVIVNEDTRYYSVNYSGIQDFSDKHSGIILVLNDITASKISELELNIYHKYLEEMVKHRTAQLTDSNEELKKKQRLIQSIMDATPDIIYIFDIIEQKPIYFNQKIADNLEFTVEELMEMGSALLPTLLHPDDVARLDVITHRPSTATQNDIFEFQFRAKNKSGQWGWYSIRDKVFNWDENGNVRQVIGVAQNITHRKEAEIQLYDYQHCCPITNRKPLSGLVESI